MDFLQACFEFHRRYLGTGASELLEDAMLDLGFDDATLDLFLEPELRAAVLSLRDSGIWTHFNGETVAPGAMPALGARHADYLMA